MTHWRDKRLIEAATRAARDKLATSSSRAALLLTIPESPNVMLSHGGRVFVDALVELTVEDLKAYQPSEL